MELDVKRMPLGRLSKTQVRNLHFSSAELVTLSSSLS